MEQGDGLKICARLENHIFYKKLFPAYAVLTINNKVGDK